MSKVRKENGNMLFLVVLTAGLIVAATIFGLMFDRFLGQFTRAQSKCDALALSMANSINAGNRVGQINELVEASRELVFSSRQNMNDCLTQETAFLEPLCNQLLVESRDGYALLEGERKNQIRVIIAEIQQASLNYNSSSEATLPFGFCFLETNEPKIDNVYLGHIVDVDSNVISRNVFPALSEHDLTNAYVDRQTNLFKGDIDARLPQDNDLNFRICPLPANVDGSCSPARLANPDVFVSSSSILQDGLVAPGVWPKQIPNAVQLACSMKAAFSDKSKTELNLISTGVCSGDVSVAP